MYHLLERVLLFFCVIKNRVIKSKEYKTKHIARLSPVYPENYDEKEYTVYSNYLNKAFHDANIRNIAITGNFGIGKSSFLKKWSGKKKYLFVSLCCFSEKSSKNLECDLLQQLLLGCGYVAKQNSYVEQKWSIIQKCMVIILCFSISATAYFLFFFDVFKPFFTAFKPIVLNALTPILDVLNFSHPIQIINSIKGIVYGSFSFSILIGLSIIIYRLVRQYKLTKIAFKLENAEIATECKDVFQISYLDRYRLDLVYALRKAARKINYTIVFEDMDRLSLDDCRSLFTELREINRLVNMHSSVISFRKTMRFIYVVHDAIFYDVKESDDDLNELMHLKFFDYIMPIVPSMIEGSSSNYITLCFMDIKFYHLDFVNEIAIYLSDYRLIKNITNEYVVLKDVYLARNGIVDLQAIDEQQLMALVIYKTLLPLDYKQIREKTSAIFFPTSITTQDSVANEAVKCLINKGWLSHECLKFVGYDYCEVKKYIEFFFNANTPTDVRHNQVRRQVLSENFPLCSEIIISKLDQCEDMTVCLSSICYTLLEMIIKINSKNYYCNLLKKIFSINSQYRELYNDEHKEMLYQFMRTSFSDEEQALNKLSIIMDYLYRINHEDYDWFFVQDKDSFNEILDRLRCRVICNLDKVMLENFVQQANIQLINWLNEFSNSKGIPEYWDLYCDKSTARILAGLKTNNEIYNYFNSV